MPFANCKSCGRLFHLFDPTLTEPPGGYWPNLSQGEATYELCPECLKMTRDPHFSKAPNGRPGPPAGHERTGPGGRSEPVQGEEEGG
jgi:hypothetical protein